MLLHRVVHGPLAKVVGKVEGAVVIRTVFKVDDDQLVLAAGGVLAYQNVALLQVVVTKDYWRVHSFQEPPQPLLFLKIPNSISKC